jgi:hypothetical protein
MELDSTRGIDTLMTERIRIGSSQSSINASVVRATYPQSGGASSGRQDGDQYSVRVKKIDYTSPKPHDQIITTNYGTIEVKQAFPEGVHWAIRATGKTAVRVEI